MSEKYALPKNVINMANHELTGINVILAYSNTILKNILGDA